MRQCLDEEERTADPEKLRLIRQAFRASFSSGPSVLSNLPQFGAQEDLDFETLAGIQDPKASFSWAPPPPPPPTPPHPAWVSV